eukprot:31779_1
MSPHIPRRPKPLPAQIESSSLVTSFLRMPKSTQSSAMLPRDTNKKCDLDSSTTTRLPPNSARLSPPSSCSRPLMSPATTMTENTLLRESMTSSPSTPSLSWMNSPR